MNDSKNENLKPYSSDYSESADKMLSIFMFLFFIYSNGEFIYLSALSRLEEQCSSISQ